MALLTVQTVDRTGYDLAGAVAASSGGDQWDNSGVEGLFVFNGGGGAITLTLDIQQTVDGQLVTDRTISIGAGARFLAGPFPPGIYNDTNGRMNITYSGVASVFVKPFKFTNT